jgi:cGMP-dependent protein kinase
MEYINGFDLSYFSLLRDTNNNNIDEITKKKLIQPQNKKFQTQFYIANILLAINYLQSKKIVHRDIKLENIMLTTSGYLKLIDFNACTEITSSTKTITGTPYYMAPELLLGKGYGLKVDFWSIGVLAYKIYLGYFPFGNDLLDPTKIYDEIINKDFSLPNEIDCYFGGFIKGLLNKNVDERIGSLNDVKKEKFYEFFEWDEVDKMNMIPPFVPKERIDLKESMKKIDVKYEDYLESIKNDKLDSSIIDVDDKNLDDEDENWGENF